MVAAWARRAPASRRPTRSGCAGCCCGTVRKHPGVDPDLLCDLARKGAEAGGAKFAVTGCLGPCGQGNVVVARIGGKIRWFRAMNDDVATRALADHVAARLPLAALRRRLMAKRSGDKPKA